MSEQTLPSQNRSPRYDAAIKLHAVEQVLLHHQAVAQVARQLQCSPQSVANWVKQYQEDVRSNHSQKSKSTLSHPIGQTSSCQHKEPLSQCSRSVKPPSRCTTFLPVEVGEIPPLISHDESLIPCSESLMPRGESRIEIVTPNGLTLRFPGETALDVLAGLVRQLETALLPPAQQQMPPAQQQLSPAQSSC